RAGDLVDGTAAYPGSNQEPSQVCWRRLARHHAVEGGRGLLARQRGAGGDFANDRFEVVHRLLSEIAQLLLAPVTCAKAASLIEVPTSFSSLVTYWATSSSLRPRSS